MTEYKELAARLREIRAQLIRMVDGATFVRDGHVRVTDPAYLLDALEESDAAIETQHARIEALEAERDEARQSWQEAIDMYQLEAARVGPAIAQLAASEAHCKRLEEALRGIVQAWEHATSGRPAYEHDLGWTGSNDNPGQIFAWYARLALQENTNGG